MPEIVSNIEEMLSKTSTFPPLFLDGGAPVILIVFTQSLRFLYFLFLLILHTQKKKKSTKEKENTAMPAARVRGKTPENP